MKSNPTPEPKIIPAHSTIRAGQSSVFEVRGLGRDVQWELLGNGETGFELAALKDGRAMVRVASWVAKEGIYFLRAWDRGNPKVSTLTTLRLIPAPQAEAQPHGRRSWKPQHDAHRSNRSGHAKAMAPRRGLLDALWDVLGLPLTA